VEGGDVKSDGVIALCSKARQALAQAKTIEDFKDVRDVGEAAIRLAKSRRDVGIEALLEAQEIVRRAERQLGAMLPSVVKRGGDRAKSHDVTLLEDLGIERMQSSRFQKIAQLPDEDFESWVSGCREAGEEMTQAAALRLAAEYLADPIGRPERELCVIVSEAFGAVYDKYASQLDESSRQYVIERLESLLDLLKQEGASSGSRRNRRAGTRRTAVAS
jgi:hypothetical protein